MKDSNISSSSSNNNSRLSSHGPQTCIALALGFLVGVTVTSLNKDVTVQTLLASIVESDARRVTGKVLLTAQSSKFLPISCDDVMLINRNLPQRVKDPNAGIMYARYTTTDPPFWISLHTKKFDRARWTVMTGGAYYEHVQSSIFIDILSNATATTTDYLHMVDVGGNIGWFSLLSIATALSVGKSIVVDVFEPNPRNRLRFCESMNLNKWVDNPHVQVNLYPVGVSSTSGGTVQMGISKSGTGRLGVYDDKREEETETFPIVALDDLADELGWKGAHILKVDVEGLELEVFQGVKRFLASGGVENVFFEGNTRNEEEIVKFRAIVDLLIESGAYAYKIGGADGPTRRLVTPVSDKMMKEKIGKAVINEFTTSLVKQCNSSTTARQCNLWWRPRPSSSPSLLLPSSSSTTVE